MQKKKEKEKIKLRAKVALIILGEYHPAGEIFELPAEVFEKLDDIVKYVALEEVSESENEE